MHDRAHQIDEIINLLACAPHVTSGRIELDEAATDAVVIDVLLQKLFIVQANKVDCVDKSIESRTYNQLLMSLAETTVSIQQFEEKYGVNILTRPERLDFRRFDS